ncbi:glycosyltransferase [Ilyobacter polytropus]|uniref:Glycosyl transferase group 1 n=1 Tax=Ilyobacter polytropus (strain ATCC 51220 / DSM 2926 / LMG 16218 / CuHBu1) TaxID=572544 RepID=E3HCP4_ILYPC|nr:glycosyltransferase [Ilyobacter polytropus]ADO84439.1 glycosyl transferase group 1 [Ilyobacter polytropus DSM 2926]
MKIVHINTSDMNGGAAIAAHRLHLSMLKQGIDSKMLVLTKSSDELNIKPAIDGDFEKHIFSKIRIIREKLIFNKYKNRENPIMFSSGKYGIDISQHPYIKEADIILLHWINGGYLSLESIAKLGKLGKKTRWTLHDMWAFTGGCHYANDCKNYEKKCGNCSILKTNKEKDITRKIWKKKEKIFKELDIEIITCSNWLGECAKNSSLLKNKKIIVQANVLDTNIFKSLDKEFCKKVLNLDNEKQYICFGAINSTGDLRKGWKYLNEALILLDKENPKLKEKVELLVFGASHGNDIEKLPFKTKFLGRVYDESTLALIYNSARIFVAPSLEDNFPNTVNESIHCGIPTISFNVGGLPDMISHKENGYLAKYKDVKDLIEGIKWGLERKKI